MPLQSNFLRETLMSLPLCAGKGKYRSVWKALAFLTCISFTAFSSAQKVGDTPKAFLSCSVGISTSPSSPVSPTDVVSVTATVNGGSLVTAQVDLDGGLICSGFSDFCSTSVGPLSPGSHSLNWSCTNNDTLDSNSGSEPLDVSAGGSGPTFGLLPNFMIVSILYPPEGNQSSSSFTTTASEAVTASISRTFAVGNALSFSFGNFNFDKNFAIGPSISVNQSRGLSESFTVSISAAQSSTVSSNSDFVNHYQDRFYLWLNPLFVVTQTGLHSATFTVTTPTGPDGTLDPTDVLDFSAGELLNPALIPLAKLQPISFHGHTLPGLSSICAHALPPDQCTTTNACGCTPDDFKEILMQDPLLYPFSANATPDKADIKRFSNLQTSIFLDGGAPVKNTFTITDTRTGAVSISEQQTVTTGFSFSDKFGGHKNDQGVLVGVTLGFQDNTTFMFTNSAMLTVSDSLARAESITLGSSTSGCDEFLDIYEDEIFHTFITVPSGTPPDACGVAQANFSLSVTPSIDAVVAGETGFYGVATLGVFGFTDAESLSISQPPLGSFATFVPSYINGTGTSELRIATSSTTPPADYLMTVFASGDAITQSSKITLRVTDFHLATPSNTQTVTPNQPATYSIAVMPLNLFKDDVTLSVTGLPPGASVTIGTCTTNMCPISGLINGTQTVPVTIILPANTTAQSFHPVLNGVSGNDLHTLPLTLNLIDFSLHLNSGPQTVLATQSATYFLSTIASAGFAGVETLTVSGLPACASATLTPNSINGSGSSTLVVNTCATTPAGNYSLTVTAVSGAIVRTVTVQLNVQNFAVTAVPSSLQSINPGDAATYTVTVTGQNGFVGPVVLSVAGLPPGTTYIFTPNSVNGSGSSILTIQTSAQTPQGNFSLTISGASGSLVQTSNATLQIGGNFLLTVDVNSQTVGVGGSTTYTLNTIPQNGFNANVTLSVSGLPAGASFSFSANPVPTPGTSVLTISNAMPAGSYTLTISGTGGGFTHSLMVALLVTGDFTLAIAPSLKTINVDGSAFYSLTVTPSGGFSGTVNLSVSGLSGAQVSLSPAAIANGQGSSTLSVDATGLPTGVYQFTVIGTSGGLSHSVAGTLRIVAPCRTRGCITPL